MAGVKVAGSGIQAGPKTRKQLACRGCGAKYTIDPRTAGNRKCSRCGSVERVRRR